MNKKEILRMQILGKVGNRELKQKEASKLLSVSCRQVRRLLKAYRRDGAKGLISNKRSKPSNNRICDELKQRILAITREKYIDFGPTFLSEKLLDNHSISISRETLRKWLMAESIWRSKRRKEARIHQARERRSSLGELVQIDGSPHDWFEGRREKCCLLVFIDDATSKLQQLRFEETETTEGYFKTMHGYIKEHGLPLSLYSDKHGIFRVNAPETTHEAETQFKRAMDNLGVRIIYANSPQAKGRVERANGILQDRLVKELRLAGISDIETANKFLPQFIEKYNKKFAVEPKSKTDAHRQLETSDEDLNLIFSTQSVRTLSKNLELSYNNTIYQVQVFGQGYTLRHSKVLVCEDLNGQISLLYKGKKLNYNCHQKQRRNGSIVDTKTINQKIDEFIRRPYKPSINHPWKKYGAALLRKPNSVATSAAVAPTG